MDSADQATPEVAEAKAERLKEKIKTLKQQMKKLKDVEAQLREDQTNKSLSQSLMRAHWPRAAGAPEWSATTYK